MNAKQAVISRIVSDNPFNIDKATNIYLYGSRVYGTHNLASDHDYLMVSDIEEPYIQFKTGGDFNVTAFSFKEWAYRLERHEISVLECLYLPEHMIILNAREWPVEINQQTLRRAVSAKSSNSFVKAKKKFTVEEDRDIYVGKKSLFHALRIPIFGKQLAEFGRIVDYSAANRFWPKIRDCTREDWQYYQREYKKIHNSLMSDFRKVAPK